MTAKEFVLSKYPDAICAHVSLYTLPSQNEYIIYDSSVEIPLTRIGYSRDNEIKAWEDAEKFIMSKEK